MSMRDAHGERNLGGNSAYTILCGFLLPDTCQAALQQNNGDVRQTASFQMWEKSVVANKMSFGARIHFFFDILTLENGTTDRLSRKVDKRVPTYSGVPRNFFRGGSTNSVEDRGQRGRGSGGGSPLVRGSGGSCNLVQEISFHIVKFS